MKTIPAALREKLLNRVKAEATDSNPLIRVVATQTSINTLLTEPIHEDIPQGYGDITVRQTAQDYTMACAYAICLDNGIANIYRRNFPADLDFPWIHQWTVGAADDVAIEYDGHWKMDNTYAWYYLETEKFPYIFTLEGSELYVQKWDDSSTRTLLATGNITSISSCKGWRNKFQIEMDQGLVIGYIRDGAVYYRALCAQPDGSMTWEIEHQVGALGQNNTSLSVIRTNDFRIGFLTEQSGQIKLALSKRNYAGMSVRPEVVHVNSESAVYLLKIRERYAQNSRDTATAEVILPYFNYDIREGSPVVKIVSSERLYRDDEINCYGLKLTLDKTLDGKVDRTYIKECKLESVNGSSTSNVKISDIVLSADKKVLFLYFASDIRKTTILNLTMPETRYLWYDRVQGQKWYMPVLKASFKAEAVKVFAYDYQSTSTVETEAGIRVDVAHYHYAKGGWTTSISAISTMELSPVSVLPI